jgi:hypothetical protein
VETSAITTIHGRSANRELILLEGSAHFEPETNLDSCYRPIDGNSGNINRVSSTPSLRGSEIIANKSLRIRSPGDAAHETIDHLVLIIRVVTSANRPRIVEKDDQSSWQQSEYIVGTNDDVGHPMKSDVPAIISD